MGAGLDLHGVGNILPGGQHVIGAAVIVGNAVAAGDDAEFHGRAAGAVNAVLHLLGQIPQVHVARDHIVEGVGDSDDGAVQIVVGIATGLVAGFVRQKIKGVERADVIGLH